MKNSISLKLFAIFIFYFGFNILQGYSNVVYSTFSPVERKSKKKNARKSKRIKKIQQKTKAKIHTKNSFNKGLFFTILSIGFLVLGALLIYFGSNILLFVIAGLGIIFLGFIMVIINYFSAKTDEIIGFIFFVGLAFLIGLFLLIYGLFLLFPLLWIVGIILLVLVLLAILARFLIIRSLIGQIS